MMARYDGVLFQESGLLEDVDELLLVPADDSKVMRSQKSLVTQVLLHLFGVGLLDERIDRVEVCEVVTLSVTGKSTPALVDLLRKLLVGDEGGRRVAGGERGGGIEAPEHNSDEEHLADGGQSRELC
jgi:hypothetical protein